MMAQSTDKKSKNGMACVVVTTALGDKVVWSWVAPWHATPIADNIRQEIDVEKDKYE